MTADAFLDLIEQKDLLEAELLKRLRAEVARRGDGFPAESLAQYLVKEGHLTFAVAQRLLDVGKGESGEPRAKTSAPKPPASGQVPPASTTAADKSGASGTSTTAIVIGCAAVLAFLLLFGVCLGGIVLYWAASTPTPAPAPMDLPIEIVPDLPPEIAPPPIVEDAPPVLSDEEKNALKILRELQGEIKDRGEAIKNADTTEDPFAVVDELLGAYESVGQAADAITGPGEEKTPPKRPAVRKPIYVRIDASGGVTVDGKAAADDDALQTMLAAKRKAIVDAPGGAEPLVLLQVDPSIEHGEVTRIRERIRAAGITLISLTTTAK